MTLNEHRADPLVSVMMPARNAGRHLKTTVQSVQAQTYSYWELIFVDDGSDDDTLAIIRSMAETDPRIKIYATQHGGRGRARNACLEHITGKYVAVCDADDVSVPERFEKQVAFLEEHADIGAVASWCVPFSTDVPQAQTPIIRYPTTPEELAVCFARGRMRFHNATAMIRKELFDRFGGYNPELRRAQDYEFFGRLSRRGIRFAALPEPLLYYRQEAKIPSLKYFRESNMFIAYAHQLLGGASGTFSDFTGSLEGRFWSGYYTVKYAYFFAKSYLLFRGRSG